MKRIPDLSWSFENEAGKELRKGKLLLAEPFMFDPNFKRAVVFITEYTEEEGAVGFVLTNKLEAKMGDILHDFPKPEAPVYAGGPVEEDTLHFLHTLGNQVKDSIEVIDGLYWSGSFEDVQRLLDLGAANINDFKFFLGYSGWSPKQLEEEIKDNSWIVEDCSVHDIFAIKVDELWHNILESMGGVYKIMSNYPEDPNFN